jgi:arylsulfatase A-like enzyme
VELKINRRLHFILCLIVGLLISTGIADPVAAKHKKSAKRAKETPNIVFILTDDQRLEDIQHMPILQRLLVGQGMIFDNYFSNVSLCCPSRTSILRGQFAHNTGVLTNNDPNGGFGTAHRLGLEDSTIATWLHAAGYRTALIGKYLNHYPGNLGPNYVPPGWDYWASASAGNAYGEYNYTLNENGKSVHYGHKPEDYGTDVYAHKAIDFIKTATRDKTPFFVYLAVYAPHGPATPAPRHEGLFADAKIVRSAAFNEADVSTKPEYIQNLPLMPESAIQSADAYYRKRLCSLQAVDEAIGSLYQTLSDTKQLDNTYIVFAADNGFHLGEHRMRRGKQTAYETDIHLPLIVRGPGIKGGARADQLAGNIDLAPTFADLAGARAPDFVDGRSLVPILKGSNANLKDLKWRNTFLVEHTQNGRGGGKKRRLTEAGIKCDQCTSCASNCNHAAPCYCGGSHVVNAVASDELAGHDCDGQAGGMQLASYGEEEAMELAEADTPDTKASESKTNEAKTNEARATEDSLQMKEDTPPPQKASGRRATRRARRAARHNGGSATTAPAGGEMEAPGAGEMGGIPNLRALRDASTLYVEYGTGEREYYRLTDDSNETNNLIEKPEGKDSEVPAGRLKLIKNSAAKEARELESAR